jgi:SAM-dependent methyltransferase
MPQASPRPSREPWNEAEYIPRTREFFGVRAAAWDTKYGEDIPAYAAAIEQARLPAGGAVIDVGCGTGRAVPCLREAVGPDGTVLAMDLTPEMLHAAAPKCEKAGAALVLADARRIPLPDASVDAVFAAGLIMHLPDTDAGFRELARITRSGGKLVLFHPTGRQALARRRGRIIGPDEALSPEPLKRATAAAGWNLTVYDDADSRFFALATRE